MSIISELVEELIDNADLHTKELHDLMYRAAETIEMLSEKAREPMEWIPCSERLPKENTEVLITLKWGIDIGEYRNGNWYSELINHYDDDNVLAWKPLPKPYRERESE